MTEGCRIVTTAFRSDDAFSRPASILVRSTQTSLGPVRAVDEFFSSLLKGLAWSEVDSGFAAAK